MSSRKKKADGPVQEGSVRDDHSGNGGGKPHDGEPPRDDDHGRKQPRAGRKPRAAKRTTNEDQPGASVPADVVPRSEDLSEVSSAVRPEEAAIVLDAVPTAEVGQGAVLTAPGDVALVEVAAARASGVSVVDLWLSQIPKLEGEVDVAARVPDPAVRSGGVGRNRQDDPKPAPVAPRDAEPPRSEPEVAPEATCCPRFFSDGETHDPRCKVGGYGYVPRDAAAWDEEYGERAGVLEFQGGYSRAMAERRARELIGPRPTEIQR